MCCVIFEFLTAWGREEHLEKVRKSEKRNVNGAGDIKYVLLELYTAARFYSICCYIEESVRSHHGKRRTSRKVSIFAKDVK